MKNAYVYPYSFETAKTWGQEAAWQLSWQANVQCAHDIESILLALNRDMNCTERIKNLLHRFGPERPMFVTALTVKYLRTIGKGSAMPKYLKDWAFTAYPMSEPRADFRIRCNELELCRFVELCREIEVNI